MFLKTFVTNGSRLQLDWPIRQLKFYIQAAILAYEVMFAERDSRDDKRQSIRAEIQGMTIHTDNSSRTVQAFCGRGQGQTKVQTSVLPP